ncbi:MAG: 4-hydroxythreonine-4-phosphate dehydrogenase PdxA [Candidatus Kapabacteria bacterium]|nr:4-hydroxythreonine-4-phosphate dehydrogenase PdxA [Candidatus Kapabacteria bacterium]
MPVRLAITCGDVNGIGLRCLAGAVGHATIDAALRLVITPDVLRSCIDAYALPGSFDGTAWTIGATRIAVEPLGIDVHVTPGAPGDEASRLAIASLARAFAMAASSEADAVVTLPISKHALQRVGWPYPGQTEMAAAHSSGTPLMVLCTRDVRVALTTVHIPIRRVADTLTESLIVERLHQLRNHLVDDLGIDHPRLAVLAIDPHAGDGGAIGTDDQKVVAPAIQQARAQSLDAHGPFPADGFFAFGAYRAFDGILAMYHDQGLIPLKLVAKGAGVNVTAGLSVVRTSPDHGTAYDRALRADVDHASTLEAIEMAIAIAQRRRSV